MSHVPEIRTSGVGKSADERDPAAGAGDNKRGTEGVGVMDYEASLA